MACFSQEAAFLSSLSSLWNPLNSQHVSVQYLMCMVLPGTGSCKQVTSFMFLQTVLYNCLQRGVKVISYLDQKNVFSEDSIILIGSSKYLISISSVNKKNIFGFDIGWSDCSAMNFSQYFSSASCFCTEEQNVLFYKTLPNLAFVVILCFPRAIL